MAYRSKFEVNVSKAFKTNGIKFEYEPETWGFTQPKKDRKYTPDFKIRTKTGITLFVETKGRLTSEDRKKILWVLEQNPKKKLVLVFQNSANTITKASRTTYADWCRKNSIEFYDFRFGLPKEWIKT